MEIITGVMPKAVKVVVYGPEGIGKTTFASLAPEPLFCDTEGSTTRMNVRRFPAPNSFAMICEQVNYVLRNPHLCKTFVLDTADWAQRRAVDAVCARHQKSGIEDFAYGKGYSYVYEDMGRLLNLLDQLIDLGINVIITAHAAMRKVEQPDEMGAYDRWELKLINSQKTNVAGMVKEWADMVLFANYETIVVKSEDKKNKAQGGKRVMYTAHHPCWDAKNRFSLPEKLPFDFSTVAHCFLWDDVPAVQPEPAQTENPTQTTAGKSSNASTQKTCPSEPDAPQIDPSIPPALRQLMTQYQVSEADICRVVAQKGYYPEHTPIRNYDPQFIDGVLVGAWQQVYNMIKGA
ncbi:MAG: ATP-binding protein [Oscillospiraceae bacterium]|nr:ATP-binding protein [Oscillospiraceae bacterium]